MFIFQENSVAIRVRCSQAVRKASSAVMRIPLPPPPPFRMDSEELADIEAPPTASAGPLNEAAWIAANVRIPLEPYRGPDSPYAVGSAQPKERERDVVLRMPRLISQNLRTFQSFSDVHRMSEKKFGVLGSEALGSEDRRDFDVESEQQPSSSSPAAAPAAESSVAQGAGSRSTNAYGALYFEANQQAAKACLTPLTTAFTTYERISTSTSVYVLVRASPLYSYSYLCGYSTCALATRRASSKHCPQVRARHCEARALRARGRQLMRVRSTP